MIDEKVMSDLDGIDRIAITTDPEDLLYSTVSGLKRNGLQIISITPWKFHGVRPGYLIISYDPKRDPRYQG